MHALPDPANRTPEENLLSPPIRSTGPSNSLIADESHIEPGFGLTREQGVLVPTGLRRAPSILQLLIGNFSISEVSLRSSRDFQIT